MQLLRTVLTSEVPQSLWKRKYFWLIASVSRTSRQCRWTRVTKRFYFVATFAFSGHQMARWREYLLNEWLNFSCNSKSDNFAAAPGWNEKRDQKFELHSSSCHSMSNPSKPFYVFQNSQISVVDWYLPPPIRVGVSNYIFKDEVITRPFKNYENSLT